MINDSVLIVLISDENLDDYYYFNNFYFRVLNLLSFDNLCFYLINYYFKLINLYLKVYMIGLPIDGDDNY